MQDAHSGKGRYSRENKATISYTKGRYMHKVTIKDVAKEAGVSISTVSNALNGIDVLNPDTRERILKVASRLNYIPNLNGRNLKSKETKVIGLFIASITGDYYGILSDTIFRTCDKRGYELNIFISDKKNNMMANLLGKRVDGAIIMNEWIAGKEVEILEKVGIPIVFLDREIAREHISSVVFDSFHEGALAGRYLLGQGHKSFGYIQGYKNNYDNIERYRGFTSVLEAAGYHVMKECVLNGNFAREVSRVSMENYLESHHKLPDAIFAANDLSAMGCIAALQSHGVRIPDDVSIIGCDDIEMSKWFIPSLTTIRTSFESQGSIATEHLLGLMEGKEEGTIYKLEGKIVERGSTRK